MEDFLHVNHHIYMNSWNSSWTSLQATFKNRYKIVDPCLGIKYLVFILLASKKKLCRTKFTTPTQFILAV